MPLHRRIPKRGFHNPFGRELAIINVAALNAFSKGDVVTPELLLERGILSSRRDGVKVLGDGEIKVALTVQAHAFSKSAEKKIAAAGGKTEIVA